MTDYKKLGIEAFLKHDFILAKTYFSLAYDLKKDEELLFLIDLSQTAMQSKDEAVFLFDFYMFKPKTKENLNELYDILNSINSSEDDEPDLETQNAISYNEFKNAVKKSGDFKSVFEDIMFSTKVLISNKDDLLDFLEDLVDNEFIEISLNYLETAASLYAGDERINAIMEKIKNYENRAFK